MYLSKKLSLSEYSEKTSKLIPKIDGLINLPSNQHAKEIRVEIGYWRKANQIHNWFIKNLAKGEDQCQEIYVTLENLITLRDTCERVLKSMKDSGFESKEIECGWKSNPEPGGAMIPIMEEQKVYNDTSLAQKLLPPSEGFFFGSQEFGPWYVEDLEDTIKIINAELEIPVSERAHWDYSYQASW